MKSTIEKMCLSIVSICLVTSILVACGKPSPASLGIQKPISTSSMHYEKLGLGVYGIILDSDTKTAQVEIDKADLPKIKVSDSVTLGRFSTKIIGSVKSLPSNTANDDNSKCTVEVALNDNVYIPSETGNLTKPFAVINLPPRENAWCIFSSCIQDGNNGKKYVWATNKADISTILEDDWQLVEVKTGETDGVRTEITSGLKPGQTLLHPVSAADLRE